MILRSTAVAVLAAALIVGALAGAHAGAISEDVAYWYWLEDQSIGTIFNPDSSWLSANLSRVALKVQQTVYDIESTALILTANGDQPPAEGFLYAYSVTNIGWFDSFAGGGLTAFVVDWGFVPMLVTVDHKQQPAGAWTPGYVFLNYSPPDVSGPGWTANVAGGGSGILPGSTVGGFWAVAPTGEDRVVGAAGATGDYLSQEAWQLIGQTTGPVPEPIGMLTLAMGAGALALRRKFAR